MEAAYSPADPPPRAPHAPTRLACTAARKAARTHARATGRAHVCVSARPHAYAHTRAHARARARTHSADNVYDNERPCTWATTALLHTHAPTHSLTRTLTHTHMHAHVHTQRGQCVRRPAAVSMGDHGTPSRIKDTENYRLANRLSEKLAAAGAQVNP